MSSDRICVFFHDTATTEIYTDCHTLSLHDALPFCAAPDALCAAAALGCVEAEPVGGHLRPGLAVELHPRVEPLHRLRIDASGPALHRRQPARRAAREVAAIQVPRLFLGEVVSAVGHPAPPVVRDLRTGPVPVATVDSPLG